MKDFKGKIAFITGGSTGAGLGQAKVFAKAGMRVAIVNRRPEALHKAVCEIIDYAGCTAADVLPICADLTDRNAYLRAADTVERVFGGPPHLLIQTAGVNSLGPAEAATFDDYDWVMGVCLQHVINGLVIFVPRMIKAYGGSNGIPKEEFHIVATSSLAAFIACATAAPYAAAKAAVTNLMCSYAETLNEYGGGATVLCPGNINSNIYECEANRPANLKNTGNNVSEGMVKTLKALYAQGIDPVELAEILKEGIENRRVIVFPFKSYGESYARMREDHEKIEDYLMTEEERIEKMKGKESADYSMVIPEGGEPLNMARADLEYVAEGRRIAREGKS